MVFEAWEGCPARQAQSSLPFETVHRHKDGHDIPAEIFLQPARPEMHDRVFIAIVRNITERKRAEEAIRVGEERLNVAVTAGHIGIFEHNHTQNTLYWSPVLREILGIRREEPSSLQRYLSLIPEAEREKVLSSLREASDPARNRALHITHQIVRPDGEIRHLSLHSRTHFAVEQQRHIPVRTIGTVLDITKNKQAEAVLQEQEARLRAIVHHVVDGIITFDAPGTVQSFNLAAEQIFGYTAAEVIGRNVKILMPEPYHSEHDGYLARYSRTREARIIGFGREVTGLRKDGSVFPLDLAVSEMEFGRQPHFTGIVRNITERKRAEQALREREEHHRLLVDQISDYAIIRLDTEGLIASWNSGAAHITGYEEDEILGKPSAQFYSSDDVEDGKPVRLLHTAKTQGRIEDKGRRLRKDGSHYWANVIITPLYSY